MRILALDTSTTAATAAVIKDGILAAEAISNNSKTHSQKLMQLVDEVVKNSGLAMDEFDLFASSLGPGSFTGLRIGAATVKALAQVTGKPIVGVPTLDALAYNLFNSQGFICPMLDAQRGMVYSALYRFENGELKKLQDFRVIGIEELTKHFSELKEQVTILGDAVYLHEDKFKGSLSNVMIAPKTHSMPRASSVAALAAKMYKNGICESYSSFKPYYIRKSQAEVEYEKKEKIEIDKMNMDDIDEVMVIEELSFTTPWSRESFVSELQDNKMARYLVARAGNRAVAYGGMWFVLDECHITNIAVHPDYRGRKIGEKIVQALIEVAHKENMTKMTLEVRISNESARNLYKKLGFTDCGIRKGYYSDTGEDGIIMWKEL